jgi:hypothetical protein
LRGENGREAEREGGEDETAVHAEFSWAKRRGFANSRVHFGARRGEELEVSNLRVSWKAVIERKGKDDKNSRHSRLG